jgi:hypothetical protein
MTLLPFTSGLGAVSVEPGAAVFGEGSAEAFDAGWSFALPSPDAKDDRVQDSKLRSRSKQRTDCGRDFMLRIIVTG